MVEESGWTLDIAGTSSKELVAILGRLEEESQKDLHFNIKKELVERVRKKGNSDEKTIKGLKLGVPKGEPQNKLAREWAIIFGISEGEFKRI